MSGKLAFSTNAFVHYSLQDALREIRAAGYAGVEIIADVPHAYPDALDPRQVTQIRHQLDQLDLAVSNINANCTFGYFRDPPPEPFFEPSLISPDPQHRRDRVRLILKTLEIARELGAHNLSITSGRMLGGMPPDAAARQFAESIRPVLDRADALDVNIGIECEPGLMIEYATELRQWIDSLGHPRLGANLDVGHSQVLGESIPSAVRLLNDRIWNLHIEDIPVRKHFHMIPGDPAGTFDWEELKQALDEIGYQRFLTVELYTQTQDPIRAARQSIEFLRKYFQQSADEPSRSRP